MNNLISAKEVADNKFDIRAGLDDAASLYGYLHEAGIQLDPPTGPLYAPHSFTRPGRTVKYQEPLDLYFEAACSPEQMERLLSDWATGGALPMGLATLVRS